MMKHITKLLLMAAIVLTVLLTIPIQADADTYGNLTYEIVGREVTITDCSQSATGELVIPDTIKGCPVTAIGYEAFDGCHSLTGITTPDSVNSIGREAFEGCINLTRVAIGDSVTYIGDNAFTGCTALTGVYITDIAAWCNIQFGEYPIYSFTHANPLYFAEKLYLNGQLVTDLVIPEGVTKIGYYAFSYCTSLVSITIPKTINRIESWAFFNCSNLVDANISDMAAWCAIDFDFSLLNVFDTYGEPYSNPLYYAKNLYLNGQLVTNLTIPDGTTRIDWGTFYNYSGLTSLIIPDSITSIGTCAFKGCSNLADVYYTGTQEQWDTIEIGEENDPLLNANWHRKESFKITSQPTSCTVAPGETAYFSVTADGTGITYQWQYRISASDSWANSPATGNKTATLTIPGTIGRNGYQYRCIITNGSGDQLISDVATLTVHKNWNNAVKSWSLTLGDNISVNFSLSMTAAEAADTVVSFTVNGVTTDVSLTGAATDESGNYIVSATIAAAQMRDSITIAVNGTTLTKQYSAREYADYILDAANGYDEATKSLVMQMLHYGAAAQTYFDYSTDVLANEGIAGAGAADVPETAEQEMSVTGAADGISFYAASLVYRDKIAVRFYFQADSSDYSFTVGGQNYEPVEKDGMYCVEVTDILPQDLDQQIQLTVTDNSGNTMTVSYNPMNYIVRMNEKGSDNLKALIKALYNYHLAAKEFCAA